MLLVESEGRWSTAGRRQHLNIHGEYVVNKFLTRVNNSRRRTS